MTAIFLHLNVLISKLWYQLLKGIHQSPSNLAIQSLGLKLSCWYQMKHYNQTSDISHTLEGNRIVDHSDVVAAPPTSSF